MAKKLKKQGLKKGWKKIKGTLQYQNLPYILDIFCLKQINYYHNNLLARYFRIEET